MSETLTDVIAGFLNTVQAINGTYYDAIRGFSLCQDHLTKAQIENIEVIRAENPKHASVEFLDTQDIMYADGWPEDPAFRPLHMTSTSRLATLRMAKTPALWRTFVWLRFTNGGRNGSDRISPSSCLAILRRSPLLSWAIFDSSASRSFTARVKPSQI